MSIVAPQCGQFWMVPWSAAGNVAVAPHSSHSASTVPVRTAFDVDHLHGYHPTVHTLYVAPSKGGGFCYLWTNADGSCMPARAPSENKTTRATGPLGLTWYTSVSGANYPLFVNGWVRSGPADRPSPSSAPAPRGNSRP